jgi:hypothetical protein
MAPTAKDPRGVAGGPSSILRFPGGDRGEDSRNACEPQRGEAQPVRRKALLLCPSPFAIDNGELIGRDPRELAPEDFAEAGVPLLPVMRAIRAKCLDCCGGEVAEARKCTSVACPLWPLRFGVFPSALRRAANAS